MDAKNYQKLKNNQIFIRLMSIRKKKYQILNQQQKQEIIDQLKEDQSNNVLQKLSQKYQISIKNMRRWMRVGIQRKTGCGRKKCNVEAEKQLKVWIIAQSQEQKRRVSRQQLKAKAIELFHNPEFKASKAWQDEFIKNYDIKYLIYEALSKIEALTPHQKYKFEMMKAKRVERGTQETIKVKREEEIPVKIEVKVEEVPSLQFMVNPFFLHHMCQTYFHQQQQCLQQYQQQQQ